MEFVWNKIQAEDIRQASVRAMTRTTDDMRTTARQFTTEAATLRERIAALRATLPIMTTITRQIRTRNADGEWETHYEDHEAPDTSANARVEAEIASTQRRVNDLVRAAQILNKAASELEAEILATNNLMQKLQDKIQSTDEVYAGKIAVLKGLIESQLARIGDIRDSFGNKFTTEACGVVYFGSSTGSILNNPTSFLNPWDTFGRILQQPAEQITDAEFGHLAWFFTLQTTVESQERFLNLFAEPVTSPTLPRPFDVNAFSICPQKVGGVLGVFGEGIRAIFNEQMGLVTDSSEYLALQSVGDVFKERFALLTVLNDMASSVTVGGTGPDQLTNVQQNVILAVGNDTPITVTQNTNSTTVTFNRGEVFGHSHNSDGTNPFWVDVRPPGIAPSIWNGSLNSISKTISNIYEDEILGMELVDALGDHFYVQHQFDMGRFIAGQMVSNVIGTATAGLGKAASTAASVIRGLSSARSDARSIQNDFIQMRDGALFGFYQYHFALRGVVITSTERPPQVLSWPTADTFESLNAFNSVLNDNRDNLRHISRPPHVITHTQFTWGQFMRDPYMVFEVYRVLNGTGRRYLSNRINANQAARNHRLENPSSQPPSDYLESNLFKGGM